MFSIVNPTIAMTEAHGIRRLIHYFFSNCSLWSMSWTILLQYEVTVFKLEEIFLESHTCAYKLNPLTDSYFINFCSCCGYFTLYEQNDRTLINQSINIHLFDDTTSQLT